MNGFQEFVQDRYKIPNRDWGSIICFFADSDEEAVDTFYGLFDEFVKGQNPE